MTGVLSNKFVELTCFPLLMHKNWNINDEIDCGENGWIVWVI